MKHYLTNLTAVLSDDVVEDTSLLIDDGLIEAIGCDAPANADIHDMSGHMVLPGLIDLHGDALEKEVEPRPGALFPLAHAVLQSDRRNAVSGITTVFHALSFAEGELGVRNVNLAAELAREIKTFAPYALVENRVHCRYEITDRSSEAIVSALIEERECDLLSFMDHTPGQGQFKTIEVYREFLAKTYGKSDADLDVLIAEKTEAGSTTHERVSRLAALARKYGIAIASHDDDCMERVRMMKDLGAVISEFPINLETAKGAYREGLATLFGAPNIVRGGSQSGNMKAVEAISNGAASCICSDYSPASIMPALFKLADEEIMSLPQAVQLATLNPARAAGLKNRGILKQGMRADLAVISNDAGPCHVRELWVKGKRVYQLGS